MRKDYLPHCRKTLAATALPDGKAWYAFQVRQQTTTDSNSRSIHKIGLDEIARIGAEMDAVARKAGYSTRAACGGVAPSRAITPSRPMSDGGRRAPGQAHRRQDAWPFRQAAPFRPMATISIRICA